MSRSPRAHLRLSLALFLCATTLPTLADEPTLDDLLNLTPTPTPQAPATPDTPTPDPSSTSPPSAPGPLDALAPSLDPAPADAFVAAVSEMSQVADRLATPDAGLDTQRLQQRILDRLDQVIAAAIDQQQPSPSSSSSKPRNTDAQSQQGQPQPGQPQPGQSQPADGPPGSNPSQGQFSPGSASPAEPNPPSLEELRKEWGNLPPRLRDALRDGLDEPYSNTYRQLTEQYYQRLAEQAD